MIDATEGAQGDTVPRSLSCAFFDSLLTIAQHLSLLSVTAQDASDGRQITMRRMESVTRTGSGEHLFKDLPVSELLAASTNTTGRPLSMRIESYTSLGTGSGGGASAAVYGGAAAKGMARSASSEAVTLSSSAAAPTGLSSFRGASSESLKSLPPPQEQEVVQGALSSGGAAQAGSSSERSGSSNSSSSKFANIRDSVCLENISEDEMEKWRSMFDTDTLFAFMVALFLLPTSLASNLQDSDALVTWLCLQLCCAVFRERAKSTSAHNLTDAQKLTHTHPRTHTDPTGTSSSGCEVPENFQLTHRHDRRAQPGCSCIRPAEANGSRRARNVRSVQHAEAVSLSCF